MGLDYGSGEIATSLENIIKFAKDGMRLVIAQVLLLVFILIVLHILYEILIIAINGEVSRVFSKIFNELVYVGVLFFMMINWLSGINILENIIEPLMFEKIPKYIFSFKVGNQPLFVSDGILLNLDKVWKTLEEVPNRIYNMKDAWKIFFDWVLKSNLGFHLMLIILMLFMYIMIILFFGDILRVILNVHLMYIFSGISFILMAFKPLREHYGVSIPKTLLAASLQYYLIFIVVGLSTGFMNYLYANYGKFVYMAGLFILMELLRRMLKQIAQMGDRL